MKARPRISEAEWEIMKRLWQSAPQSALQLASELAGTWTESTVKTLLNRLVRKGALTYEAQGKAYLYSPAVSQEECRAAESISFLERVFDGSPSPLLAHFVNTHPLSDAELAELEKLVRSRRKK
jgi:BlaI family transcriptional regulator, penicillinase repressor